MTDDYTPSQSSINRRMERIIGYDAYNNTERHQARAKQRDLNSNEKGRLIGFWKYNLDTGERTFVGLDGEKKNSISKLVQSLIDSKK